MCVCVAQSFLTLCDLMHCSLPGSLSIGFSRQEYWSGLPFLPSGDLPNPGIKPKISVSPAWQVVSLLQRHQGSISVYLYLCIICQMAISDGKKTKAVEGRQRVIGCSFTNDDGGDIFKQKREVTDGLNHEDASREVLWAEEAVRAEALHHKGVWCVDGQEGQGDRSGAERHGGADNWKVVGWQARWAFTGHSEINSLL